MSDLISRQAVLDIIHRFFTEEVDKIPTKKTEDGEVLVIRKCQPLFEMNKAICKRIKALSSVSPTQNCVENALDMRCDDLISRQAVLDITWGEPSYTDALNVLTEVRDKVKSLPSANPQEPSEDEYIKVPKKALKYRTAGMVAYNVEWLKNHFDIERAVICGAQEPKIGHWIEHPEIKTSTPEYLMFYECSECGDKQCFCKSDIHKKRFCSNCGCRMVEPQESEVKNDR